MLNKLLIPAVVLAALAATIFYFSLKENSTAQDKPTDTNVTSKQKGFYMSEVEKNSSRESCWTVIEGKVYDLTEWISGHPGGADKILNICGRDGSSAFNRQHERGAEERAQLEKFLIGDLARE